MPKSDFKFHTVVRVRWMECDAQGIVFNGAYMGYLEIAQAEYFRNLGFSIYNIAQQGYFDSAVVKATLEFKAPARVDDLLELRNTSAMTRQTVPIAPSNAARSSCVTRMLSAILARSGL